LVNYDRPGECSPERDRLWRHRPTFKQPERNVTLMVTSAQVVKTPVNVTRNSPSQDHTHPDNHNLLTYGTVTADARMDAVQTCLSTLAFRKKNLLLYKFGRYRSQYGR